MTNVDFILLFIVPLMFIVVIYSLSIVLAYANFYNILSIEYKKKL